MSSQSYEFSLPDYVLYSYHNLRVSGNFLSKRRFKNFFSILNLFTRIVKTPFSISLSPPSQATPYGLASRGRRFKLATLHSTAKFSEHIVICILCRINTPHDSFRSTPLEDGPAEPGVPLSLLVNTRIPG